MKLGFHEMVRLAGAGIAAHLDDLSTCRKAIGQVATSRPPSFSTRAIY